MSNVVLNLGLLLALKIFYDSAQKSSPETKSQNISQKRKECVSLECDNREPILVDRALNTVLQDDRLGGNSLMGARNYVKQTKINEAQGHPGVLMIAST